MVSTNNTVGDRLIRGNNGSLENIVCKDSIITAVRDNGATILGHFTFERMFASKSLDSIEACLEMNIADHAFSINKDSTATKGLQCKKTFGVANKTRFRTRKMVNGSRARAKRASRKNKREERHQTVNDGAGRVLGAPRFAAHFTIETKNTFGEDTNRCVTNSTGNLARFHHCLDNRKVHMTKARMKTE